MGSRAQLPEPMWNDLIHLGDIHELPKAGVAIQACALSTAKWQDRTAQIIHCGNSSIRSAAQCRPIAIRYIFNH